MKKLIFIAFLAAAMMMLWVSVASADGGPHGGFTATTDACAGCHRAHTAIGPNLLLAGSTYDLCISCHGAAGTGANTNVDDGIYLSSRDDPPGGADGNVGAANTPDNSDLLGGGFVNYQGVAVTSSHDPTGATAAAWGNGVARGATANLVDGNMDCASCHDPHGTSTYRIIRETLNGVAVTAAQVDEGAAKDYDTEQWGAGQSTICAACHGAYHVTQASAGSVAQAAKIAAEYGNDVSTWAHRMDMPYNYGGNANPETVGLGGYTLPLAQTGAGDNVVCQTCHLPHGAQAAMTGFADPAFDPAGAPGPIPAGDGSLLRLPNRGVCEVCHQK